MASLSRRGFVALAGGTLGAIAPLVGRAQQRPAGVTGVQHVTRYAPSLIYERKPFAWPGGKTLAVWVIPHVEVWDFDSPTDASSESSTPGLDVINYASRDYGIRLGLDRIARVLDGAGIRATVAINAAACQLYPTQIGELRKRGWEFMAHGITNSRTLGQLSRNDERDVIRTSLRTVATATGMAVRGWLSPGQIETANTLDLLAEEGVRYTADWVNDDQPYRLKVGSGDLFSIPFTHVVNDIELITKGAMVGSQYEQSVVDQFEQLVIDSRQQPRVLGVPVHPYLIGQPDRIAHFERAIQRIVKSPMVWLATGSEIVDAYTSVAS